MGCAGCGRRYQRSVVRKGQKARPLPPNVANRRQQRRENIRARLEGNDKVTPEDANDTDK